MAEPRSAFDLGTLVSISEAFVMSHDVLDRGPPQIPRSFRSFTGSRALS